MIKKIMSAILVMAMGVSLVACGGANEKTSSNSVSKETTEKIQSNDSGDGELTDITFVLDWTPNTNHTGVYVADSLGYYKEAGFNVTIVQPPDDGAEMLVASGEAQFGVSFQDYLMPAVSGDNPMPVAAVAAILQHNTSGIISRADKGIESPKDLEGHTYATWDLDIEKNTLRQVVETDGGSFDKVELIPSTVTDEPTALQSDMVDSIWVYEGWGKIACDLAGIDTNYFNFKDIDSVFDYYSPVVMGNTEWMSANTELAKAFLAATARGYEYCVENPDDAADILLEAVPELDSELAHESQKFLADQYVAEATRWGIIDGKRWDAFYQWIEDCGIVDYDIPDGCGFTNEYL